MEAFLARGKSFPLTRTYVMGILNVTPDSFSDGGRYLDPAAALARAREMEKEGADIPGRGRPVHPAGAHPRLPGGGVGPAEGGAPPPCWPGQSWRCRWTPSTPQVAEKALEAGAHIINDVSGFGEEMLAAVAGSGCGCVVMFSRGRGGAGRRRGGPGVLLPTAGRTPPAMASGRNTCASTRASALARPMRRIWRSSPRWGRPGCRAAPA